VIYDAIDACDSTSIHIYELYTPNANHRASDTFFFCEIAAVQHDPRGQQSLS
jgi:hypothetical protein